MKRSLALSLLICFLLSGCFFSPGKSTDEVSFYYVRSAYQEDMTTLVASEYRDVSGHEDDLNYILALYLIGPAEEDLVSPFPANTELLSTKQTDKNITIKLSDTEKSMNEPQFALSCACLSMTCLDLTEAKSVTIISGTRYITMTQDNLSLTDNAITSTEEIP